MNETIEKSPVCQHCNQPVAWVHKPADVSWPAFAHVNNNRTKCPEVK